MALRAITHRAVSLSREVVERYRDMPWDAAWWGVATGILVGFQLLEITGDQWMGFREATFSGFTGMPSVANPPYTALLLYPLAVLPAEVGKLGMGFINILCLYLVNRLTGANKWLLLFSVPGIWLLSWTQLDGLTALGVALGYWAVKQRRPLWQGVATLLLCVKPHIGGPLALFYLIQQRHWRGLVVSSLLVLFSFAVFGFWPLTYLHNLIEQYQGGYIIAHFERGMSLFPWGSLLWLPVLMPVYRSKQRVAATVAATILSMPYAEEYSLLSMLAVPLPIWVYPLISSRFLKGGLEMVRLSAISVIMYPILVTLGRHLSNRLKKEQGF